jgi:hypothetical protein
MADPGSTYAAGLTNNFVSPGSQVALPTLPGIGGGDSLSFANLDRDSLNALIDYRNRVLAAQQAQSQSQVGLSQQQMAQQQQQFEEQKLFNEQAQRAAELQAYRQLQQTGDIAERSRQTTQMTSNFDAAIRATQAAQAEALARQGISQSSYAAADASQQAARQQAANELGQSQSAELARQAALQGATQFGATTELARRQQLGGELSNAQQVELARQKQASDQALAIANTIGGLRGSSNAFKQLEVNGFLNQQGSAPLLAALAGAGGVAAYRGLGGTPEAATLGTMARDVGATPAMVAPGGGGGTGAFSTNWQTPLSMGGGFSAPTQAGLLRIANQNASMVPHGEDGQPTSTYSTLMDQIGRANTEAGMGVLGNAYGPGSDAGSWILKDYQQLIQQSGTSYFDPDDSRLLTIYQSRGGLSTEQARMLTHYANDYYKTYGQGMTPKQLDETIGQVANGKTPDAASWTDGAKGQIPGFGTPQFKPPPAFTPLQPMGSQQPTPTPPAGTPPPAATPPPTTPVPPPVQPGQPTPPPVVAPPGQVIPGTTPPVPPTTYTPPPAVAPQGPAPFTGPAEAGTGYLPMQGGGWFDPVSGSTWRNGVWTPATQSGTHGQVVAAPSVAQSFLAPSATGQAAQSSQQAATATVGQPAAAGSQVKPDVKYTYDYLPGGKGLGYLGTDGKMFNTQWQPVA